MSSWPLNGKKGGNRKHSKIDTLPPEMKATVEEMIMDKRILAHHALHSVQAQLGMNRDQSYCWLQTQMGLPGDQVHIAKCGDYRCEQIIRICENATAR